MTAPALKTVEPSRRVAIVKSGETLRCPAGHRFDDPLVWTEGGMRCLHKGRDGRLDCGKMVLLLGGFTTPAGEPIYLLSEVTPEEMQTMKREGMRWQGIVAYLGLQFGDSA